MPKVTFATGQTVNFDSMPSQADIEEVANKLGINKNIQSPGHPSTNPDLQGGATSPANIKAQQDLSQAQAGVSPLAQAGQAVQAVAEPAGRMANSAMFGIPGITSELLSGGKLVNPLTNRLRVTQGGTNIFEGKDMTTGQQLAADVGGAFAPVGALLNVSGVIPKVDGFINSRMAIGKELGDFQKQFGTTVQGAKVPIERLAANIGDKVSQTADKLSEYKKTMDNMIFKEAEKSASDVHSKLPTFFRNASTTYGKRLDDIAQVADDTGNITRGEAHDLVNNIKADLAENQLDTGQVFKKVDAILAKHPLAVEDATRPMGAVDMSAEVIPFKELNSAIREVMKKTSSSFKSGQRVTPEDVAAMVTKEHYGQFLQDKLPPEVAQSLKDLNNSYKPIAQARKELGRIFKPYNQFSEGEGANFLAKAAENIANKDLSEGKTQLLNLLEKGNELTPGIGDVTSRIKALGDSRLQNEKQLNAMISDLLTKKKRVEDLIATKGAMNKKIGYVLAGIGLGGGTAGTVYRAGRNMAELGK